MSFIDGITVVMLTYNEEENIARTLEALRAFSDVLVVDSGSTDATPEIAMQYDNVRIVTRKFDSHAAQWNYGLEASGEERNWILALDADYVVSEELLNEMSRLDPDSTVGGYWIGFDYCVYGRRLSRAIYPPVVALFRRLGAAYVQDGHTQRVRVSGPTLRLQERMLHDDRKSLDRWLTSQASYSRLEADRLIATPWADLSLRQRIRRVGLIAPWLVPLYCLIACRGILDGWAGIFYALQRGMAEAILAIRLLEARVRARELQE